MISIAFGLGTACFFAAGSLLNSRAVRFIPAWSVVAWMMLVGLVITLPFVFVSGVPSSLDGSTVAWLAVAGCGNVAGLVCASFAFRIGKVGIIAPILATEGAISATLAALSGESIAPSVAMTLLVIVGGIVLAAVAPDPEPIDHERPVLAALIAVGGAACFGASLYAAGHLSADLPISWVLLPPRLVGVAALAIPLLITGNLQINRKALPLVLTMGVTEVLGFTCFAIGAQYAVAVTSVLASQFAPIAAVAAYLLFRERLGKLQVTGVVVLVLGVATLTLLTSGSA